MASITIARPASTEYAPFYGGYVNEVPEGDLLAHLERQGRETAALLRRITESKSQHRYAPGKWTIREVVGHMIDAERVFTYRAMSFARGESAALPSCDPRRWRSSVGSRTGSSRVRVSRATTTSRCARSRTSWRVTSGITSRS